MNQEDLPNPYENVLITYQASVSVRGRPELQIVERRAFYCDSDGYYNGYGTWVDTPNGFFQVPRYWQTWSYSDGTSGLVPRTFQHYGRVMPEEVIEWDIEL